MTRRTSFGCVLGSDRPPLELRCRCQLVAVGEPVARQHNEALDLLHACETLVGALDLRVDRGKDLRIVGAAPGGGVRVQRDERDVVGLPVSDRADVADERPRPS